MSIDAASAQIIRRELLACPLLLRPDILTVMSTVTLLELQQQPGAVLDRVQAGELLLVVRDGRAVAELRPAAPIPLTPRPRGLCAGMFRVPDDFDAPLPEDVLRDFEGR